ncbi:MAG: imidazoleglycerol-phosphate dehydratase HisB [Ruminococcus sp.]|nr:imidazoleglycerol-phosphate dehydratase HisB [Ruminococcus sp.]MCM1381898.1 imidazoleglycerol-phosphate dehydratase HisB [Muribaculaceae bacterium]MCM1480223.1 imidazoleglycerol-phosphate dehydratase HisB [Muribaculaceae bacterium]
MRNAEITRKTKETDISVKLDLDGGNADISTGIGFFDHMLTAFAVHGGMGLTVKAVGDLNVDGHHTVEDVGIVLGKAFKEAIGDMKGIARYGTAFIPMDEALGFASIDISGRPFLVFDAEFSDDRIGEFDTCLTEEFFRAFAVNAGVTLHLKCEYGKNDHHIAEALFKAAAHAVKAAKIVSGNEILSTKGAL